MKTGRNDPCPCGSGRKYKKCCLAAPTAETLTSLSPVELVEARRRAFDAGDFGFIYDTYHPDSYFRRQFPDRAAYLRHGRESLAGDYTIRECRILKERSEVAEAWVLFYLDTRYQGEQNESFELSRFLRTPQGWRYHSSQKLSRQEYPGTIDAIDWADFERVKDKVYF